VWRNGGNRSRPKLNASGGSIRERDCNSLPTLTAQNGRDGCEPDGPSIARQNSANDNVGIRLRLDDSKLALALGEKDCATAEQQTHEWKRETHGSPTIQLTDRHDLTYANEKLQGKSPSANGGSVQRIVR
jgi:hypothetical protein